MWKNYEVLQVKENKIKYIIKIKPFVLAKNRLQNYDIKYFTKKLEIFVTGYLYL